MFNKGGLGLKVGEYCLSREPRIRPADLAAALRNRSGFKLSDSAVRHWFAGEHDPSPIWWPFLKEILNPPDDFFPVPLTVGESRKTYDPGVPVPREVMDILLDAIEDPKVAPPRKTAIKDFIRQLSTKTRATV